MSKLIINGPASLDADKVSTASAGVSTTLIIEGPVEIECETGKVSDSFHTFDELYDHRCLLFLVAQALTHQQTQPYSGAWKSRKHHDGSSFDGWFIAGLELPQGQITYHIPDKFWDLSKGLECDTAPYFDGHTSQDVLERLRLWLSVPSFPND